MLNATHVCRWIPPLWDLPNTVAVNPFLGFAEQPLVSAAKTLKDGLDAEVLPPARFYQAQWQKGAFGLPDLEDAARRFGNDPALLETILSGETPIETRTVQKMLTYAERHDQQYGTSWNDFLVSADTRWCAVYARQGSAFGWSAGPGNSLFTSWREAATSDRSPEIAGLAGWRSWAGDLPASAEEAVREMLARLEIPAADRTLYLYRLLGGVYGWASFFRRTSWEAGTGWEAGTDAPGPLPDLLALRICSDAAVRTLAKTPQSILARKGLQTSEDENTRLVFQEALENGFVRSLLTKIAAAPFSHAPGRPSVQAVFCIDVRSEPLRRHLEAASETVETLGFAGFFGVSLSWQEGGVSSARCPVLLKPTVKTRADAPAPPSFGKTLKSLQSAPSASFSVVELLGAVYGAGLASDALGFPAPRSLKKAVGGRTPGEAGTPFELEIKGQDRLDLAASILKNLGLHSRFGRLVLLCGHQGNSANNPHAAGLNCGACGGHSGAVNARVAAALLNDPAVRVGLTGRGFQVPTDTHFLPGVHDTSTDEVTLLDTEQAPRSHQPDLAQLRLWLEEAAQQTRAERAPALGLREQPPGTLEKSLRRRAGDWSEVRPEWGLARNAAFIAARRTRTRGADLEGRAFLHEYDWTTDPTNSILGLILSAPMVVASWINLQYFASTVDNARFGSGTKALHNRVEDLGVVLGNGGDLRPGLPLQSVHTSDGRWYHEPLRLQVIVEAPPDRLDAALSAHAEVRSLVENGWVRLYALDPNSQTLAQWGQPVFHGR